MPLYEYQCRACGRVLEAYRRMAQREVGCPCPCGGVGHVVLSVPTVIPDLAPFYHEGLGRRVESRAHLRRVLKAVGAEETGSTTRHGARGTAYSIPGQVATSVPPSGAYAP